MYNKTTKIKKQGKLCMWVMMTMILRIAQLPRSVMNSKMKIGTN